MADADAKDSPRDERTDLVEVARVDGPFEAELIKSFLGTYGVGCVIRGRTAPFVYPLTVDGMAEFKILVSPEDREKALELLAARPSPDDEKAPSEQD